MPVDGWAKWRYNGAILCSLMAFWSDVSEVSWAAFDAEGLVTVKMCCDRGSEGYLKYRGSAMVGSDWDL